MAVFWERGILVSVSWVLRWVDFWRGGGGEDRSEIREREKLTPERVRERASSIVL